METSLSILIRTSFLFSFPLKNESYCSFESLPSPKHLSIHCILRISFASHFPFDICLLYICYLAETLYVYTFGCSLHSWSPGPLFLSFIPSVSPFFYTHTYGLSIYLQVRLHTVYFLWNFYSKMTFRWALIAVGSENLLVLFLILYFYPFFCLFHSYLIDKRQNHDADQ